MTIDDWLKVTKKKIDSLDADLIALQVFAPEGADRSWLVANDVVKITTDMQKVADGMAERRFEGEPLAYILGEKEFYGRKFEVGKGVLIPRPETENLIELIKGLKLPKRAQFLEVGTGSGCIAVTLALEFPQSYVLASDISLKALAIAERNDLLHEGRVDFVQSNLLADMDFVDSGEHFDVVVANLPYVSKSWRWVDMDNLRFEPRSAIFARGENGLSLYRRLFQELRQRINNAEISVNFVVAEADPCQHQALQAMAEKYGFKYIKTESYGLLFENQICFWGGEEF